MQLQENSTKNTPLDMIKWQQLVNEWDASKKTQIDYCKRSYPMNQN